MPRKKKQEQPKYVSKSSDLIFGRPEHLPMVLTVKELSEEALQASYNEYIIDGVVHQVRTFDLNTMRYLQVEETETQKRRIIAEIRRESANTRISEANRKSINRATNWRTRANYRTKQAYLPSPPADGFGDGEEIT